MPDSGQLESQLIDVARQVASALLASGNRCVFAESCTGGKMAASMTTIPGVSSLFCGSAVTYREETKTQWLSISAADLRQHTAESDFTTLEMAKNVLAKTPEADFAVSITGHLGPGVESKIDGVVFVTVISRASQFDDPLQTIHRLKSDTRTDRQTEAAGIALRQLLGFVEAA